MPQFLPTCLGLWKSLIRLVNYQSKVWTHIFMHIFFLYIKDYLLMILAEDVKLLMNSANVMQNMFYINSSKQLTLHSFSIFSLSLSPSEMVSNNLPIYASNCCIMINKVLYFTLKWEGIMFFASICY